MIHSLAAMSRLALFLAAVLLLPAVAVCSYPWPDNVTQHSGYIEVREQQYYMYYYMCFYSNIRLHNVLCHSGLYTTYIFVGEQDARSEPVLLVL